MQKLAETFCMEINYYKWAHVNAVIKDKFELSRGYFLRNFSLLLPVIIVCHMFTKNILLREFFPPLFELRYFNHRYRWEQKLSVPLGEEFLFFAYKEAEWQDTLFFIFFNCSMCKDYAKSKHCALSSYSSLQELK